MTRDIEAEDTDRPWHIGSLRTAASWIRNFVRSHPAYKFDSVVSEEINYDLMVAVDEMCVPAVFHPKQSAKQISCRRERGLRKVPDFLPANC